MLMQETRKKIRNKVGSFACAVMEHMLTSNPTHRFNKDRTNLIYVVQSLLELFKHIKLKPENFHL